MRSATATFVLVLGSTSPCKVVDDLARTRSRPEDTQRLRTLLVGQCDKDLCAGEAPPRSFGSDSPRRPYKHSWNRALAASIQSNVCELKKVEQGSYCGKCKKVLDPADVVENAFCKMCSLGRTGDDRIKTFKVSVCVRSYYVCQADEVKTLEKAKCKTCKKELKTLVDRALVNFVCEGCSDEATSDGPCANPKCRKEKKKRVKWCAKSGTFPHQPERRLGD